MRNHSDSNLPVAGAKANDPDARQHTLLQSLGLHVLPGALTTAAFLALKPLLDPIGYPPLLAFLLAVTLVDLPVLLDPLVAVLLGQGDKRRIGLNGQSGACQHAQANDRHKRRLEPDA